MNFPVCSFNCAVFSSSTHQWLLSRYAPSRSAIFASELGSSEGVEAACVLLEGSLLPILARFRLAYLEFLFG